MEKKLKHLEFLQLVITRMNVNSFLIKGWAVTIVAAIFALAKDSHIRYVFIAFVTTTIFWLLDAYYLSQERQYRGLYNVIRIKDEKDIDFDMNASVYNSGRNTWINSFLAPTLCLFYVTVLSLTIIVVIIALISA